MELKNFFMQDLQGNVIPDPTVYIYQPPGSTTLATGIADANGNIIANPLTGNSKGQFQFAAPGGDYDMRIVGAGRDFTMRVRFLDNDFVQGNFNTYIVAGESSRVGEIRFKYDWGNRVVPDNHIDRVHHVEFTLPDAPGSSAQRELHAYSFTLETNHHEPNGGDIRGIKGIVRGNGGQANLRAAHFAVQGYNGHSGDLTGALADVFHSDLAPGAAAVGKSTGFLSQVGAGISDGFLLRCRFSPGYDGVVQNVKYGYRVSTGANAVLPTIANFQGHGGGGGSILRGLRSHIDETVLSDIDALGKIMGQAFRSGHVTINNDSVANITPVCGTGFLLVWAEGTSANWGVRYFRVGASPAMSPVAGGGSFASTTGALIGMTGTAGNLTVSAKTDGTIDIENRSGAPRTVSYMFIGRS